MKRLLVLMVAVSFIFCGSVFAVETTKAKAAPVDPAAAVPAKAMEKETKMSATGKVTEISDTMLKIDRHVKGKTEAMEFSLEKACSKISAGDKVKVSYVTKDGKNVASKVTKVVNKKTHTKKKVTAKEEVKPTEEPVKAAK
ncbi:MAG: hypothetical protein WC560_11855 [Syntrophales bacterium]